MSITRTWSNMVKFAGFALIALAAPIVLFFIFATAHPQTISAASIVINAASPARVSGSDPVTTAAFNPPANSLILAMVSADSATGGNPTITITNNGTPLTWTLIAERSKADAGAQDGEASSFYALLPAARSGMTVTANITNQNQRISLKVYVVTGHDTTNPIGAIGEGSSTTNDITPTIYTSTIANSLGFGVANDWSAPGLPTSTDEESAFHIGGYISGLSAYKATETVSAGTPVTMNFNASGTGSVQVNWVGFEVKPGGPPAPPDTIAPTISLTAPTDGATVSGSSVAVSAVASDNVAVTGVQFKLDSTNLGAEDIASPYSISWDSTGASNGPHVLTAVARDAAGNTTTSTGVTITINNIDTTAPVISSISASSITSTGTSIIWTTNESSDSQVEYGTTVAYGSSTVLDTNMIISHSQGLSGLSPSTLYHYRIKSRDGAGNLAISSDNTFTTLSAGNTLTIDGSQTFQTMDGFGVNINSLSWKNGESIPAINLLADQMGATTWRVVFDEMNWESSNDDNNPNNFNWTYYNSLYSNTKFQHLWGTLGYLNQKGFNANVALSFMGIGPSWMGGGGTINTSMEDEWVESVASLVYYAKNTANVNFGILDPINEPLWDGIEGPMVDEVQLTRLLNKLSVKLDGLGLSGIRFMAPETAGGFSTSFVGEMMSDPVVMSKIDHIAFHQYGGLSNGADAYIKNSAYPNKTFWVTEVTDPVAIMSHIGQGPTSVMVWEGFDSVYNHAIRGGHGSTAPNDTGGLPNPPVAYQSSSGTYSTRPIFYQDAAIFKYVTSGATRIASNESSSSVTTYAFHNPSNGRITIIGQNTGGSVNFTGTINNLPALSVLEFYRSDTNALTRLSDVTVSNGTFSFAAPSNTFFVLTGLTIADTTPPSSPSNLTANGGLGFANIAWQAATDNIGVVFYNIYRSLTSGFIPSTANRIAQVANLLYTDVFQAGTYFYKVTAQDGAGNIGPESNEASATITSDTTAPIISITAPAEGSAVSGTSITVSANASDNVGVVGVQFKLDNINLGAEDTASPHVTAWDTTSSANGTHVLIAIARDAAGNISTSAGVNVTVTNPPTISEISVNSITQTSATINWTTNVPTDSQTEYGLTSSYGTSTTLDPAMVTSHSQTITGLVPATTYHYRVLSRDATSVLATSSDNTFTTATPPDTTPPSISLTAPLEGATVSGSNITVSASASDNVGVVGVQFKLDGSNLNVEDATSPYSTAWNASAVANGSHVLTAVARDAAGNTTTSTGVVVIVNNPPPSPISRVQGPAAIESHNVSSHGITFSTQPVAGNMIVVGSGSWKSGTAATISSVTDNCGNTYQVANSIVPTPSTRLALYYAKNIATCANFRVTITYSSLVNGSMAINEYTGLDAISPLETINSATGNSLAVSSGVVNPASNSALYVGFMLYDDNNTTITPAFGWTQCQEIEANNEQAINLMDRIGSGAQTANWTLGTSRPWGGIIATFKGSGQ